MLSEIVHSAVRYLLIGAGSIAALVVVCMVLVAFADEGVQPMKLNRGTADPDLPDVDSPDFDSIVHEYFPSEHETQETPPGSSANDEEDDDQAPARRQARAR